MIRRHPLALSLLSFPVLLLTLVMGGGCQQSQAESAESPGAALASERTGPGHDLRVRLVGLETVAGSVRVAVYESDEHMARTQAFAGTIQTVAANEMDVVFSLPSGTWGITSFHDVNGNGELDTNLVGMPTEPFAFSNNARGEFGPPTFEQIAFQVNGPESLEIDFR